MVLDADGSIHVLGENAQGQLGNNSTTDSTTWTKVGTACPGGVLTGAKLIATVNTNDFNVRYTSHAILDDGSIIGWGLENFNTLGQSANGTYTCPVTPCFEDSLGASIPDPKNHVTIVAGGHITPTITLDGKVCNIGHNADGAFGDGTTLSRTCYQCIDSPPLIDSCVIAAALAPKPKLFKAVTGASDNGDGTYNVCLLYTSPSPRDKRQSRMPSSA